MISVKWGQRSPYNNAAPLIEGQRALTGCVATAIAQVMAYHEKPSGYNGVSYNWSEMKQFPTTPAVAHLFRSIGDLVKMDWGTDTSGAKRKNIPQCFEKMGYRKPNNPQIYSQWDVITSIKAKCPVIICGNWVRKYWVLNITKMVMLGFLMAIFIEREMLMSIEKEAIKFIIRIRRRRLPASKLGLEW